MKSCINKFRAALLCAALVFALSVTFVPKAEAASLIYDSYFGDIFAGNIAINSDTFKCMLVTSSYTANKGTHDKRDDITNEVSGTGYTAGGTTCTVAGSLDTTNHRYDVTVTGPSWTTATITARQMVVYKSRGGASSADNLVCVIDFTTDVTSTASTFQVTVSSPLRIQNSYLPSSMPVYASLGVSMRAANDDLFGDGKRVVNW